ncbi:hydroxyisourate hydrolase [Paracoccus sp. S-4012]|uniref:hydroxyisourate hydrolase n=1 Tax=Paracoccus sp. S-4012 TaxID=2665648 RepID=UPI0012B154A4|nr:hydroxyisourate hydrolase [Paracoccus sp. S-4012]MRX49439.1 hydroxyisourate hydrolase [Paracoccus sp. S-4012]
MTGWLTTHVLDTARGRPAAGMAITLHRLRDGTREAIARVVTNGDGRTDTPILPAERFTPGTYELTFHVGDWLAAEGIAGTEPRFLGEVPIRFGMAEAAHYHVPLLVSPFGYSTYRGS